jgi:sigma-E factor negative regulatory protein RseA
MSKESREHLSSLMDGEISRETGRFLVRRLGSDSELRMTWARYHLVRDCLRHHEGSLAGDDLNRNIKQALADEEVRAAPRRLAAGWLKPITGAAIAASVALMAIVTVGPGQGPVSGPAGKLAERPQTESFVSPNNGLVRSPYSQEASASGGLDNSNQKMNSYLLRHYQVTGSTGGKGFVTFVPIVVTRSVANGEAEEGEVEEKATETAVKEAAEHSENGNESSLR